MAMNFPSDWRLPQLIPISASHQASVDYWTANLLNASDWAMEAHLFTNPFGAFPAVLNGDNQVASRPVVLVTPQIICCAYANYQNDGIQIALFNTSDVIADGSAYSAGATGIASAIKHTAYASVEITGITESDISASGFYIVPWDMTQFLVCYSSNSGALRRIYRVSTTDCSHTNFDVPFSAGSWGNWIVNRQTMHPFRNSEGYLVSAGSSGGNIYAYKHNVDTGVEVAATSLIVSSASIEGGLTEMYDGSFVIGCAVSGGSNDTTYLISQDLSTVTALTGGELNYVDGRMSPFAASDKLFFGGAIGAPEVWTISGTTISRADFPPSSPALGTSDVAWGCMYNETYALSRYMTTTLGQRVALQKYSDGSLHPTLPILSEVDPLIPVGDRAKFDDDWQYAYDPTLASLAANGGIIYTYTTNLVGIPNNGGDPHPLMRATRLTVSDSADSSPAFALDGVPIPTVNNILGGSGVSVTTSGSDVTITASGGGGSGGGNIAGAYDIEAGGDPVYTDLGLSEEFEDGTLNANWTVTVGASGTVNPIATTASTVYDLTTRSKGMLIQCPNTNSAFRMRAPVIAVGEELIAAISISAPPVTTANSNRFWLSVSASATDAYTGTYSGLVVLGNANSALYTSINGTGTIRHNVSAVWGNRFYWRLIRDSGGFHFMWSIDGTVWVPTVYSNPTGAAYVWLVLGSEAAWTRTGTGDPIHAIHWIRHRAYTGIDPW